MKGLKIAIIFHLLSVKISAWSQQSLEENVFHPDSIRRIIEVLASDSLEGRFTNSPGHTKAALFIADQFHKAGLKQVAGNIGYYMPADGVGNNIVGAIKGKSKAGEIIVFSAHYDHVGTGTTNPYPMFKPVARKNADDNIFNGANDNASGVSAMICLARYFQKMNNNERTLLFVAFTGEELGLKGSSCFASELEVPDSIVAVINIEMIGRSHDSKERPYITGAEYSDLKKILNNELYSGDPEKYGKSYFINDPFDKEMLFQRSDNFPLAKKGIPAHTIMVSSPQDDYYHHEDDEPATLDYNLMSKTITAIAVAVKGLVNGTQKPKRISRHF